MNRRGENPYDSFKQSNTGRLRTSRSTDLFSKRKKRFPFARVFSLMLIALVVIALGSNFLLNSAVRVETITVTMPRLPSAFEGYTILHLSDLYGTYLGEDHAKLKKALSGQTYSAVCITGDMTAADGNTQAFLDLLDLLGTKRPIFFVTGEQDPAAVHAEAAAGENVLSDFILDAEQRGATYVDAPVYLESMGSKIWFTPESALMLNVEATIETLQQRLASDDTPNRLALEYQLDRAARIRDAREQMAEEDVCVVLTHAPLDQSFISGTSQLGVVNPLISRIDLVLAGHLNGGQAALPLVGPIYLPGRGVFPGTQDVSGLSRIGELLEHISPGLGVNPRHVIRTRLFNPPTITLIKLTGKIA